MLTPLLRSPPPRLPRSYWRHQAWRLEEMANRAGFALGKAQDIPPLATTLVGAPTERWRPMALVQPLSWGDPHGPFWGQLVLLMQGAHAQNGRYWLAQSLVAWANSQRGCLTATAL